MEGKWEWKVEGLGWKKSEWEGSRVGGRVEGNAGVVSWEVMGGREGIGRWKEEESR